MDCWACAVNWRAEQANCKAQDCKTLHGAIPFAARCPLFAVSSGVHSRRIAVLPKETFFGRALFQVARPADVQQTASARHAFVSAANEISTTQSAKDAAFRLPFMVRATYQLSDGARHGASRVSARYVDLP
jgi:hypothetical protein